MVFIHRITGLQEGPIGNAWKEILQNKVAPRVGTLSVHVVRRHLAVHLDDNVIVLRDYFLLKPRVRRDERLFHEDFGFDVVGPEAAGFGDLAGLSAVDLGLVTRWCGAAGAEVEGAAKTLATVAAIADLGLDPETKVFIIVALAE